MMAGVVNRRAYQRFGSGLCRDWKPSMLDHRSQGFRTESGCSANAVEPKPREIRRSADSFHGAGTSRRMAMDAWQMALHPPSSRQFERPCGSFASGAAEAYQSAQADARSAASTASRI